MDVASSMLPGLFQINPPEFRAGVVGSSCHTRHCAMTF
jgi:hypothetical protein